MQNTKSGFKSQIAWEHDRWGDRRTWKYSGEVDLDYKKQKDEENLEDDELEMDEDEEVEEDDVDASQKDGPAFSVFDAPRETDGTRRWNLSFGKQVDYNRTTYFVFRENSSFVALDKKKRPRWGKEGEWLKNWSMPAASFARTRNKLLRSFRYDIKKARKKFSNQQFPNGRYRHLEYMAHNPFTAEFYGKEYAETPEWRYHENENEWKAQWKRAKELELMLMKEAEVVRIARMKELGVWLGEEDWRKSWKDNTVPYIVLTPEMADKKKVYDMSTDDAKDQAAEFVKKYTQG